MTEMKSRVLFIGDVLIDCIAFVGDAALLSLGLAKGERQQRTIPEFNKILFNLPSATVCAGGSVVNSAYVYAMLGGGGSVLTAASETEDGQWSVRDLEASGITVFWDRKRNVIAPIRKCLSLVTPDGERTMLVSDGARIDDYDFIQSTLKNHDFDGVFLSSYLFDALGGDTVLDLVKGCKNSGRAVFFSLSDKRIVAGQWEGILSIVKAGASVFCNQEEHDMFLMRSNLNDIREILQPEAFCAMTMGAQGSRVFRAGAVVDSKALIVSSPLNATGAGDHYAGAYIAASSMGKSDFSCASFASTVAGHKVMQATSRLNPSDLKNLKNALLKE